jgi:hypothetical protein
MKEEKEVIWLIKLYNSEYSKSGIFGKQKCACIKEFERLLDAPENNSSFRNWIKQMKEIEVIEFCEKIKIGQGNIVDGFIVNKDAIIKRLREIKVYSDTFIPFVNSIATIWKS